jgi:hypothetical protein
MVNKLELSGNELMVYAMIYGFSQDKKSGYEGGAQYLYKSCGISRRTAMSVLDRFLEKKLVLKEYFIKNGVKFCRYKTNPDFIPKENDFEEKRNIENASLEENSPMEGSANSAPVVGSAKTALVRNLRGGSADSAPVVVQNLHTGSANSAPNITTDINLDTTTTTPEQSDLTGKHPPGDDTAAADTLSPENIKKALLAIDSTLFLKADFYSRAAAFMSLYYLDKSYLVWLYKQCELRNPDSFDGFFFTLFFAENMVEKYKLSKLKDKPPPPAVIKCPVCSLVHEINLEKCPNCNLPKDPSSSQVKIFTALRSFTLEKRNEYLQKENDIYSSCGVFDVEKRNEMISALQKEFGFEVRNETPSRSYHP